MRMQGAGAVASGSGNGDGERGGESQSEAHTVAAVGDRDGMGSGNGELRCVKFVVWCQWLLTLWTTRSFLFSGYGGRQERQHSGQDPGGSD